MARLNVRESAEHAVWGGQEIKRLFAQLDTLPDLLPVLIEPGSAFEIDGRIQDYDPANDQVLFLLGVARDHLTTFQRMLVDPNGGLPPFAGYTLLRAAIEAAGTAFWLRMPGTANARIGRSLWLIVNGREETTGLARRLNIENVVGYERLRARVDAIVAGRHGLTPGMLERRHTKTSILNEVDQRVPRRTFSCLEAWQACSGLTHSNRSSALMFLEHESFPHSEGRALHSFTASSVVTAEVLYCAMQCVQGATDKYLADCAPSLSA